MRRRPVAWGGFFLAGVLLATSACGPDQPAPPAPLWTTTYGDGVYRPGSDTAYGTWATTVPDDATDCYWEVYGADDRTRRANGTGRPGATITIHLIPGDQRFITHECGTWIRVEPYSPVPSVS